MDLEKKAIDRLKLASEMSLHHYNSPLICTYSGGKDSDVLLELFKRSGIPFEVHHSHTTVDAPPTVYHIRTKFRELEMMGVKAHIQMPLYKGYPVTMWSLIPQVMTPPTRIMRYCCSVLKESNCGKRFIATGVRWDESKQRSNRVVYEKIASAKKYRQQFDEIMLLNDNTENRKMTECCMKKNKMVVNPIIDWKENDIWEYIDAEKISTNVLYGSGYSRVGCVGCPMAGAHRIKSFKDFPTYQKAYIQSFEKMLVVLNKNKPDKVISWKNGTDVFKSWMGEKNFDILMDN